MAEIDIDQIAGIMRENKITNFESFKGSQVIKKILEGAGKDESQWNDVFVRANVILEQTSLYKNEISDELQAIPDESNPFK